MSHNQLKTVQDDFSHVGDDKPGRKQLLKMKYILILPNIPTAAGRRLSYKNISIYLHYKCGYCWTEIGIFGGNLGKVQLIKAHVLKKHKLKDNTAAGTVLCRHGTTVFGSSHPR